MGIVLGFDLRRNDGKGGVVCNEFVRLVLVVRMNGLASLLFNE